MPEPAGLGRLAASRWFDPAFALVALAACLTELFALKDTSPAPRVVAAVVIVSALIAVRRRYPAAATCVAAAALVAVVDYDEGALPQIGFFVPFVLAYSCGAHAQRRRGLAAVGILAAALQIQTGFADFPNFEIYLSLFGGWWVGTQVGRRRRLVVELAERTAQLETEQDAFTQLAVRRERARIARELHDIVAHHLAVIVIQAGAGRMAGPRQADLAAERFTTVRESAQEALAEMSRLVDIIEADRRADVHGLAKLHALLDDARAGGVRVRFTPLPAEVRVPDAIEDGAYRVVQEGLTNAIKHAPGAEVSVRLALSDEELEVEVEDAGGNASSELAATGSGLGLTGMRERVESLGGNVDCGPQVGGGWRLNARLPLAGQPLTPAR